MKLWPHRPVQVDAMSIGTALVNITWPLRTALWTTHAKRGSRSPPWSLLLSGGRNIVVWAQGAAGASAPTETVMRTVPNGPRRRQRTTMMRSDMVALIAGSRNVMYRMRNEGNMEGMDSEGKRRVTGSMVTWPKFPMHRAPTEDLTGMSYMAQLASMQLDVGESQEDVANACVVALGSK